MHKRHHFQQMREVNHLTVLRIFPLVGIHILPEQCHFPITFVVQIGRFGYNTECIAAAFAPAREGHYAKRAHIITASHDRDKRGHAIAVQAQRTDVSVGFLAREEHIHPFFTVFGAGNKVWQIAIRIGTDDQIHQLFFFQEFLFQTLGHTAQHADQGTRILFLDLIKHPQALAYGFFRFFANRTGIDQDQIRRFHVARSAKAYLRQNGRHDLAITEIHLTAVAFDVKLLPARRIVHGLFFKEHLALLAFVYLLLDADQGRVIIVQHLLKLLIINCKNPSLCYKSVCFAN